MYSIKFALIVTQTPFFFLFLCTKSRLVEVREHKADQDGIEQKEQQKERREIVTAGPRDKIDGDGQTTDGFDNEG